VTISLSRWGGRGGALRWGRAGGDPGRAGVRLLIAALLLLVGPPLLVLLEQSVSPPNSSAFSLAPYADLARDFDLPLLTRNTALFSAATTVLALCLVVPVSWLAERTNARYRTAVWGATFFAFGTPPLVYLAGWTLILARTGPVNSLLAPLGLRVTAYSFWGLVALEALVWCPLGFLLLSSSFRLLNPELEEAAATHGGGAWAIARRVTIPLVVPALAALAWLVFIRTIESFEIPALLGTPAHFQVLTVRIYDLARGQSPPNYASASAFAVLLIVAVSGLLWVYGRLTREARRFQTITGRGFRPRMVDLGRLRPLGGAVNLLYAFLLTVAPILTLVWASFLPFYQHPSLQALHSLTLRNYAAIFNDSQVAGAMRNSLLLGLVTATIVTLLTAGIAWAVLRDPRARARPAGSAHSRAAGVSRHRPGRGRAAAVPGPAGRAVRHAGGARVRPADPADPVQRALQPGRPHPGAWRAGGGGPRKRRVVVGHGPAGRAAADDARPAGRLAVRLHGLDARPGHGADALRPGVVGHLHRGVQHVLGLTLWPAQRAVRDLAGVPHPGHGGLPPRQPALRSPAGLSVRDDLVRDHS
jgi:ABC-type Fe3+ transport system permease subunit